LILVHGGLALLEKVNAKSPAGFAGRKRKGSESDQFVHALAREPVVVPIVQVVDMEDAMQVLRPAAMPGTEERSSAA